MVQEVAFTPAYVGICECLVDFERSGCNPFAVLIVASVLSDLADVDLRVEVGGECLAVVSGVAVHYVEVLHLREMVLGGICCEYS